MGGLPAGRARSGRAATGPGKKSKFPGKWEPSHCEGCHLGGMPPPLGTLPLHGAALGRVPPALPASATVPPGSPGSAGSRGGPVRSWHRAHWEAAGSLGRRPLPRTASFRESLPTAGWAPSQGAGTGPTRGGRPPTRVRPVPLRASPNPFLLSTLARRSGFRACHEAKPHGRGTGPDGPRNTGACYVFWNQATFGIRRAALHGVWRAPNDFPAKQINLKTPRATPIIQSESEHGVTHAAQPAG